MEINSHSEKMHHREELTQQKALDHAIQLRARNKEIDDLCIQQEEEACRRAADQEIETQMTEHILQYEDQIRRLNDTNKHLASKFHCLVAVS